MIRRHDAGASPRAGAWAQAVALARRTPASRNRCVDFLRAASILVVVFGHWLMAAPWVDAGEARLDHMLAVVPWSQWLTWGLQVMPVFFFVGGYANGISWDAAERDARTYREWVSARLQRLLGPVLVLLLFWTALAAAAHAAGVAPAYLRAGSQVAFVPTWFLAVYAVVVLAVPLSRAAWRRTGMLSFWVPALLAAAVDAGYFGLALTLPGWVNYLLVWGAIHQLGYAWLDGHFDSRRRAATWLVAGLAGLALMTELGPWPRSLVGVPGDPVSNTTPPHLPLLALAAFQLGGILLVQRPLSRLLQRARPWAATILVNSMIMTVFLWHSTVMMLLFAVAFLLGGVGLEALPGSAAWWAARLPWLLVFVLGLLPALAAFRRFERSAPPGAHVPPAWRSIAGCLLMAGGLALLALDGVSGDGPLGLRVIPVLLPIAGAVIGGIHPFALEARAAGGR